MKKTIVLASILLAFNHVPIAADAPSAADEMFRKMARQISRAEKKLPNKTIAVYGFEVIGKPDDPYGRYATEKLTHEIVSEGSFMVIERSRIDQVLKEQSLSLTGAVDSNTAARIGKILAVDAVVIGTILRSENSAEFIARVIQSEKGIILASANERIALDGTGDSTLTEEKERASQKLSAKNLPAGEVPATTYPQYEAGKLRLSLDKRSYSSSDKIVLNYSGMPGYQNDWISLVKVSAPDDSYDQWFYTYGKTSGTYSFNPVSPGEYEIRVYFDWSRGGYIVRKRLKLTVQ